MSGNNTNTDILLAGAIAAFTVDLLVYPLDTLKTRIQSPDYVRLYTLGDPAQTVKRAALFRGLYQGVGSVIIATLPSSGAFFTTYEGTKAFLTDHNPRLNRSQTPFLPQPVVHALASSISELVSCAIITPAEVIKQNAQMVDSTAADASKKPNATLQTLARFRANPFALWNGYTALAGRNLPFTALQFPLFEKLKESIRDYRDRQQTRTGTLLESGLITAVSAGSAGSVAAVITTPIDVIKTRIMLRAGSSREDEGSKQNKQSETRRSEGSTQSKSVLQAGKDGIKDAFGQAKTARRDTSALAIGREILAEQGIRGLWRGGALRGVWTMLGSGLYLSVYESGRIYLARRRGVDVPEDELF